MKYLICLFLFTTIALNAQENESRREFVQEGESVKFTEYHLNGNISQNMLSSLTLLAISCVYWDPKSRIKTFSCIFKNTSLKMINKIKFRRLVILSQMVA